MAYQTRLYVDTSTAPETLATDVSEWQTTHNALSAAVEAVPPRKDGTRVGWTEVTAALPVTVDPTAAWDALESLVNGADWYAIQTRQAAIEADARREDPTYYPVGMDSGLRAPVSVSTHRHNVSHGAIHAVVGGREVTVEATTLSVAPPADTARTDALTITADGETAINGDGLTAAELTTHPAKIVSAEPVAYSLPETEWTTAATGGDPPAYLADPDTPMPDPLPSAAVDRTHISAETAEALRRAREASDTQAQLDHILDVLDVIDI
jgi:hypothetical protein